MSALVACPRCARQLSVPSDVHGKRTVRCPGCDKTFEMEIGNGKPQAPPVLEEQFVTSKPKPDAMQRRHSPTWAADDESDAIQQRQDGASGRNPALWWGVIGGGSCLLLFAVFLFIILFVPLGDNETQVHEPKLKFPEAVPQLVPAKPGMGQVPGPPLQQPRDEPPDPRKNERDPRER
ncbi:MAG: hypothetical protein L0215_05640 [Gemmataceae bacterium]|nr:hypothetical protein [Gemmataceae bacterium]